MIDGSGGACERGERRVPEGLEVRPERAQSIVGDDVQVARAGVALAHEARALEDTQVLRDGGPGHREPRRELSHGLFPIVAQQLEHAATGGIAECIQDRRRFHEGKLLLTIGVGQAGPRSAGGGGYSPGVEADHTVPAHARRPDLLTWALLVAHGLVWLAVLAFHPVEAVGDDVARFVEIATAPGTLYRDVPVEYMPLEALLIRGVLDTSLSQAAVRVVAIAATCDVLAFWMVRRWFGERAGRAYLAIALPLQVFMIFRLDMVSVVMVLASFGLATAGWRRTAAAVFAAALLFKLWPIVLLPVLWRRAGRRAALLLLGIAAAGLLVWIAVGGIDAVRYVTTFRGAQGWHIESTVGSVVALLGAESPRFELGTMRVGSISDAAAWALRGATAVALVAVWWRSRSRDDAVVEGMPAAAAVAALIACSPVASAQYVAWIVPWMAIAAVERRRVVATAATVVAGVLAAASFLVYWEIAGDIRTLQALSIVRAICVVAIPVAWLLERREPAT